mmetsp:Transcript_14282/g.26215  ORF Transcript_14282/g.26215 Transcript_14282/m.26215 type:complete len:963 (+) Transcript_14282:1699-4587(+)
MGLNSIASGGNMVDGRSGISHSRHLVLVAGQSCSGRVLQVEFQHVTNEKQGLESGAGVGNCCRPINDGELGSGTDGSRRSSLVRGKSDGIVRNGIGRLANAVDGNGKGEVAVNDGIGSIGAASGYLPDRAFVVGGAVEVLNGRGRVKGSSLVKLNTVPSDGVATITGRRAPGHQHGIRETGVDATGHALRHLRNLLGRGDGSDRGSRAKAVKAVPRSHDDIVCLSSLPEVDGVASRSGRQESGSILGRSLANNSTRVSLEVGGSTNAVVPSVNNNFGIVVNRSQVRCVDSHRANIALDSVEGYLVLVRVDTSGHGGVLGDDNISRDGAQLSKGILHLRSSRIGRYVVTPARALNLGAEESGDCPGRAITGSSDLENLLLGVTTAPDSLSVRADGEGASRSIVDTERRNEFNLVTLVGSRVGISAESDTPSVTTTTVNGTPSDSNVASNVVERTLAQVEQSIPQVDSRDVPVQTSRLLHRAVLSREFQNEARRRGRGGVRQPHNLDLRSEVPGEPLNLVVVDRVASVGGRGSPRNSGFGDGCGRSGDSAHRGRSNGRRSTGRSKRGADKGRPSAHSISSANSGVVLSSSRQTLHGVEVISSTGELNQTANRNRNPPIVGRSVKGRAGVNFNKIVSDGRSSVPDRRVDSQPKLGALHVRQSDGIRSIRHPVNRHRAQSGSPVGVVSDDSRRIDGLHRDTVDSSNPRVIRGRSGQGAEFIDIGRGAGDGSSAGDTARSESRARATGRTGLGIGKGINGVPLELVPGDVIVRVIRGRTEGDTQAVSTRDGKTSVGRSIGDGPGNGTNGRSVTSATDRGISVSTLSSRVDGLGTQVIRVPDGQVLHVKALVAIADPNLDGRVRRREQVLGTSQGKRLGSSNNTVERNGPVESSSPGLDRSSAQILAVRRVEAVNDSAVGDGGESESVGTSRVVALDPEPLVSELDQVISLHSLSREVARARAAAGDR